MDTLRATSSTSHQVDRYPIALCKLFPKARHRGVFFDLCHSVMLHHCRNSAPVRPVSVRCCELFAIRLNGFWCVFLILLHLDDSVTDRNLTAPAIPQIPRSSWISETAPPRIRLQIFNTLHRLCPRPRRRRCIPVPQRPSVRFRRNLLSIRL